MAVLFGSAKFTWTDGGAQTHTLRVPLQEVRPAFRGRRWVRESVDLSTRDVRYAGTVYEIIGVIRYDDAPQSLIDLLFAGWKGITVTYDDGTNTHACHLIAPGGEEATAPFDEDQKAVDEHRVEVRLRKTDGTAFSSTVFTG